MCTCIQICSISSQPSLGARLFLRHHYDNLLHLHLAVREPRVIFRNQVCLSHTLSLQCHSSVRKNHEVLAIIENMALIPC